MSTPRRKTEPVMRAKIGLVGFNKNARIVKFGDELLTDRPFSLSEKESKLQTKGSKVSSEITIKSKRPFLANLQMLEKPQVSKQSKKVTASIAEVWSSIQNDRINNTDSKAVRNISTNSQHTTTRHRQPEIHVNSQPTSGRRRPESYSRRIFDLDQDENELESTLDDPGVFRTDGVGGKSVSLSNIKTPCGQPHPDTPKVVNTKLKRSLVSQRQPQSEQTNKRVDSFNLSPGPKRSSSVTCTGDVLKDGVYIRDRSKSDSNSVRPVRLSKEQEKHLTKQSAKANMDDFNNKEDVKQTVRSPVCAFKEVVKEPDSELVTETTGSATGSSKNSKVEQVTAATQTDEDFSNEPFEEVEITEFDRVLVASKTPLMSLRADETPESDNDSLSETDSFQHNQDVHEQSDSMQDHST